MIHKKSSKQTPKSNAHGEKNTFENGQINIKEYFRKLRRFLKIGLIIAFITPIAILSIYFHIQFSLSLKESSKLNLTALAKSKRSTIELFLQERVVNIFNLFHSVGFSISPTQNDMDHFLQNLRQASDAFIDVGFFNSKGVQIGYAGPYPYLYRKDYSNESWFITLLGQSRNYYISDIYLGFRNKPHFTIAVKQIIDGQPYIMRVALDPDKFYLFLRNISRGKAVEAAIVNKEGLYQVVDPERGELLGPCDYMPRGSDESGIAEVKLKGNSILIIYTWLKETPWMLMIRQPLNIAYAQMYHTRNIMIAITALIIIAVLIAIWFTTDILMKRAQRTAEARKELRYQLIHASKLASVGEIAAGVAHEINNPLAIIAAETGVIRDILDPNFNNEAKPEDIRTELDHIDTAVFRAKGITHKLLNFARKNTPKLIPTNVNKIMDEVVGGLKEREFMVSNIDLVRNYDPNIPEILLDPDQISQVFLNLINNAGDAIEGSGMITLSTQHKDGFIHISVTDTGRGMTSDRMKNIFMPFFTTKEVGKGTGLGLSVSLGIVESMGGRIDVQSILGAGSSFTVVLPIKLNNIGGVINGAK